MATNKRFVAKNGVDNNSKTITNVADPASAQDAATKAYVDAKPAGLTLQSTNANGMVYLNASSQGTTSTKVTYAETSGLPRLSIGTPGFFTSVFGHEINISHTDFVGHAIRNSSTATGANSGIVLANDADTTNTYSAYLGLTSSTSTNPNALMMGSYAKMILESSDEMSTRVNANTAFTINTSGQTTFSKLVTTTLGLNANSQKITNLATPTAATDAANKSYVDNSAEFVATQNINLLDGDNAANYVYLDGTHFGKILRVTNTTTAVNYGYIYLPLISSVPNNGKQNITIMNNTEKGFDVRILPRTGEFISDRANFFFPNGIIQIARRGIITVRVIDGKWHLINEDDIVNVARTAAPSINCVVSVLSDGTIPTFGQRGYLTLTVTRTAVGRYTLTMPSTIWAGDPQAIFAAWDAGVAGRRFFSYNTALAFPGNSSIFLKTLDEAGNYADTSFHCIISYPTINVP